MDSRSRGRIGESIASSFLEGKGYVLLKRNYICPYGEIDLIMEKGGTILFVEVKLRRDDSMGDPLESVTPLKLIRMRKSISRYLEENPSLRFSDISIGVIGITGDTAGRTFDLDFFILDN